MVVEKSNVAYLSCLPEVAAKIMSLSKIASVPLQSVTPIDTKELPPAMVGKQEEINSVEASLRIDAIISAGFRMSRSKASKLMDDQCVFVNWKRVVKPIPVTSGQIISIFGYGNLEIIEAQVTSKGRYRVKSMRSY